MMHNRNTSNIQKEKAMDEGTNQDKYTTTPKRDIQKRNHRDG